MNRYRCIRAQSIGSKSAVPSRLAGSCQPTGCPHDGGINCSAHVHLTFLLQLLLASEGVCLAGSCLTECNCHRPSTRQLSRGGATGGRDLAPCAATAADDFLRRSEPLMGTAGDSMLGANPRVAEGQEGEEWTWDDGDGDVWWRPAAQLRPRRSGGKLRCRPCPAPPPSLPLCSPLPLRSVGLFVPRQKRRQPHVAIAPHDGILWPSGFATRHKMRPRSCCGSSLVVDVPRGGMLRPVGPTLSPVGTAHPAGRVGGIGPAPPDWDESD
jgi:hypothetical protein